MNQLVDHFPKEQFGSLLSAKRRTPAFLCQQQWSTHNRPLTDKLLSLLTLDYSPNTLEQVLTSGNYVISLLEYWTKTSLTSSLSETLCTLTWEILDILQLILHDFRFESELESFALDTLFSCFIFVWFQRDPGGSEWHRPAPLPLYALLLPPLCGRTHFQAG